MPDISEQISHSRQQAVKATPLAVSPKNAGAMLGYGKTTIHKLLKTGELESFGSGKARRITTASIADYIRRKLEAGQPARRGPGRPRKNDT